MDYIRTILPLAEFKADLARWIETLSETQEPVLVTRHGKGAFVAQPVDSFVRLHALAVEAHHQIALLQVREEYEEDDFAPPRRR